MKIHYKGLIGTQGNNVEIKSSESGKGYHVILNGVEIPDVMKASITMLDGFPQLHLSILFETLDYDRLECLFEDCNAN